jgi:flagellin
MRINTNMIALTADRSLGIVQDEVARSTQKLSSGLRVNLAKDDPAALTISEKMRSQVRAIGQAARNSQDGVSLIQTAEGALDGIHQTLQRMRELAVQAANGTLNVEELAAITGEVNQLIDNVDRIATTSRYDDFVLFNGLFDQTNGAPLHLQVGANGGERLAIAFNDMQSAALGDVSTPGRRLDAISMNDPDSANQAIAVIDIAIDQVSAQRSNLGGAQNALEAIVATLNSSAENLQASQSRIRDLDVANETVAFTKWQILSQAGTAVLAQANVFPQNVLQLLKG